jgi:hypothetical protein
MLGGMNWGCLTFLILFPAGIFIWAAGEMRRRKALPPEELKELEADEKYGAIDPELECIFCHSKNCVRAQTIESLNDIFNAGEPSPDKKTRWRPVKTHCMDCGSHWEMFPPEEKQNSPA